MSATDEKQTLITLHPRKKLWLMDETGEHVAKVQIEFAQKDIPRYGDNLNQRRLILYVLVDETMSIYRRQYGVVDIRE